MPTKKKVSNSAKPYWEMDSAELAKATEQFDVDGAAASTRPLSPKNRQAWDRVQRGRGRPKIGRGSKKVLVSIELGLLEQADQLAARLNVSRAGLIAQGLSQIIASEGGRLEKRASG